MVQARSLKFMFLLVLPLMLLSLVVAQDAQAALAARGPVDPANGFPTWYMDSNGLTLSLCGDPADLNCIADGVVAGNPFSAQIGFGGEAFWWATETPAIATGAVGGTGGALMVMAMEAAFFTGDPAAGQQQAFGRMRIRIDADVAGTYTVTHPFGTSVFEVPQERIDATGGTRAIDSDKIGLNGLALTSSTVPLGDIGCEVAPCDFDLALASGVGPFLRWDPAVAPAAPVGYLGDPAVPHAIIGGVNDNFAVSGPANAFGAGVSTIGPVTDFIVSGKILNITPAAGDYFWTWYDQASPGFQNWVLGGNPAGSGGSFTFGLQIGGSPKPLPGAGTVAAGDVMFSSFPGTIGGPVRLSSMTGGRAVTSQRTLLGNSLDEVAGQEFERLSDRFLWTWYDNASPGFTNWILVSNPDPVDSVFVRIAIDGLPQFAATIPPGGNVTPTFPGIIGGPVEVEGFVSSLDLTPKDVMASQRVLSNNGTAFNEEPGVPAGTVVDEISDHYNWPWYDMVSAGASNWILVANPEDAAPPIFFDVVIAGNTEVDAGGPLAAGEDMQLTFPGVIGGPVEVITYTNPADKAGTGADSIASQRVIWGPSFEETYGIDDSALDTNYHWTWYDMVTPGVINWVLIANPTDAAAPIFWQIIIDGLPAMDSGATPIAAGDNVMPTFPGTMAGPVEVRTFSDAGFTVPANSIASQRVLWNGHFNEVMGTMLLPPIVP